MTIRAATPEDASLIKKLVAQLGYTALTDEQIREKIEAYSGGRYALLIGQHEGNEIGFIALHWFDILHSPGLMGRITAFCVDEAYRSKGLGAQMLEGAEKFLISKGCTKLEVTSNERRTESHQFYLNKNYRVDSKRFTKYPPASV
jgi:GNAT superfamily N-acetyltransferase